MDNQYNYYRPDSDENRGAGNQQGFGAGPQKDPKTSKPKKGYMKKVALVVGAAVLFGAVGGVTMQGTSYLTGKLLGKNTKSTVGTTKTVSNAKLTTSTSTVTSDVSDIVENTLPSIVSITNMSVQEVQNFFGGISQQESESAGSGIIISQNPVRQNILRRRRRRSSSSTVSPLALTASSQVIQTGLSGCRSGMRRFRRVLCWSSIWRQLRSIQRVSASGANRFIPISPMRRRRGAGFFSSMLLSSFILRSPGSWPVTVRQGAVRNTAVRPAQVAARR